MDDLKKHYSQSADVLKQFRDSLNFGSSSPLGLRDQEGAVRAALQPYLNQINSGQAVDQQAYRSAAQSFLDIERQLYGSTDTFFRAFDEIQAATSKAIGTIDNAKPIATVDSPFVRATADATKATADSTKVSNEILAQQTELLAKLPNIEALLSRIAGNPVANSAFIATARGFLMQQR